MAEVVFFCLIDKAYCEDYMQFCI